MQKFKTCSKCEKQKSISEFASNSHTEIFKDGMSPNCRECGKAMFSTFRVLPSKWRADPMSKRRNQEAVMYDLVNNPRF